MNLHGQRTFVGFGFGAIQAGLLALEAYRSGNFERLVLAEVAPDLVRAIRADNGHYGINVAYLDRVESVRVGPVEIYDPAHEADRAQLVDAVGEASEVATAIPSVRFYKDDTPGSVHRILALGLLEGGDRPRVVYTAENHLAAAEHLREAVLEAAPEDKRGRILAHTCFVNTVIGKMSALVTGVDQIAAAGLVPIAPDVPKAFLVESFRHILISPVNFPGGIEFSRGLDAFEEKVRLEPFEAAKLYGHNALHALVGYVAAALKLVRLEELRSRPALLERLHQGFLDEAGAALVARWRGSDPLFTDKGFRSYVDDLFERMLNPYLGDLVERITRDPARKLGWNDRLIGAMRLALDHDIMPANLALGAAAALYALHPAAIETPDRTAAWLAPIWRDEAPDPTEKTTLTKTIITLISEALERVRVLATDAEVRAKRTHSRGK